MSGLTSAATGSREFKMFDSFNHLDPTTQSVIFTGINTFGTRMNQIYADLATAVDALVP